MFSISYRFTFCLLRFFIRVIIVITYKVADQRAFFLFQNAKKNFHSVYITLTRFVAKLWCWKAHTFFFLPSSPQTPLPSHTLSPRTLLQHTLLSQWETPTHTFPPYTLPPHPLLPPTHPSVNTRPHIFSFFSKHSVTVPRFHRDYLFRRCYAAPPTEGSLAIYSLLLDTGAFDNIKRRHQRCNKKIFDFISFFFMLAAMRFKPIQLGFYVFVKSGFFL